VSTALPKTADVVIVGGGIVGAATAHTLARAGLKPLVLEKGAFGGAVSGASLACISTHMMDLDELPLLAWTRARWAELDAELGGFEYNRCGQLRFIAREADIAVAEGWIAAERAAGLTPELLDPAAVREVEPALTGPILAASWSALDAVVNPFLAVRALLADAQRHGAAVRAHTPVTAVRTEGGRVAGVTTPEGDVDAPVVVLASGPWTARLAAPLGVVLPMLPRKAQCLATVRVPEVIRRVVGACESAGGVEAGYTQIQQAREGQVLFNTVLAGGTVQAPGSSPAPGDAPSAPSDRASGDEPARDSGGQDAAAVVPPTIVPPVDLAFVRDSVETLLWLFPGLADVAVLRSWVRYEAVTPDSRFVAGPAGPDGLWIAAGDNGTGFVRSPAIGRLIADGILGGTPPFDAALYRADRFDTAAAA
jgi:glycine/D-amino acid oxidase-like deaminating enzyme